MRDRYFDAVIGKEIGPAVKSVPYTNNPLAVVSDHFFGRATKTLDAICVLCELGFTEDAFILGRTIFEASVYLKTITLPESVQQRQVRATSFIYDRDHRQRAGRLKRWNAGQVRSLLDKRVGVAVTAARFVGELRAAKSWSISSRIAFNWRCSNSVMRMPRQCSAARMSAA